MNNITTQQTYVCRRAKMCSFLMEKGFAPYRVAPDRANSDFDVFLFNASPELYKAVTEYINTRKVAPKVAIRVKGGLVSSVYANADVDVVVYDLDVSDFPDDGEQEAADQRKAELDELVKSPGWRMVW